MHQRLTPEKPLTLSDRLAAARGNRVEQASSEPSDLLHSRMLDSIPSGYRQLSGANHPTSTPLEVLPDGETWVEKAIAAHPDVAFALDPNRPGWYAAYVPEQAGRNTVDVPRQIGRHAARDAIERRF